MSGHFLAAAVRPGSTSALRQVEPRLLVKFELDNAGASHKVRAARHIVRCAVETGEIIPGRTTVIEKTGGNFGLGLLLACADINVPVELAVGLSFSPIKRRFLELSGARLIGVDQLQAGATPREVVEWHLANATALGKSYFYTDQFNNPGSVVAHEYETGPEIVDQLKAFDGLRSLTFVSCAGTGAHLTGITRALRRAGLAVDVTLVEPAGCDSRNSVFVSHRFEGMAVGVNPPLLDWGLVTHTVQVDYAAMFEAQQRFATAHGYLVGNTSAACLAVALELADRAKGSHKVLTIAYDHGLWYA
ncbi:pyridoxal-phosphate dependent enzyme [Verminephrobacter aporrectodeae]|uniref:pyridoxal-phosphate dependent enzyme n=1 Tax=Verminephrobacter aporrectodeae TaxID=1110389 RepID=UPI0002375351|nr:pyridoxal-phosphate dependent enzyme [Verminephrobacter aporrectodeae]MCW5254948.1 pyridoxal-phosphate dependent enzyme [Verminephrobacter aporrectodeae subsp. tuberculatae]MCW8166753.1 pyridoxal-phosphate dependent enzyme [Verminephrobacter aporrectodeae subsp. tuberculatae]MCW8170974.1 pyridoxal-phosphate dependent enzyme [Verminephrobacter aporrectodeae subsp. tuberculatae]MCW8176490.1 pyridoxal-phosphate dependent enzyme [Verminephrobacter aporrectodeae subsp. tuberculatae]MCW8204210.1 